MKERLLKIYTQLFEHFGPQDWWPANSPFEVVVGAILTQNTRWENVELAIAELRRRNALTPKGLEALSRSQLEEAIRPAGFFRQKARRLHGLLDSLETRYGGELTQLLAPPLSRARQDLLALEGVGPETADAILLYAGGFPTFVVDAYTRRLFSRVGLLDADAGYDETQALFMQHLPSETTFFNEYHALIVEQCKRYCLKRKPQCAECPLVNFCSGEDVNQGG